MDACGNMCTDISTESTDVHRITCPYIYTKGTGVHRGTSTEVSMINRLLQGRTNLYDKYEIYEPKQYIVMNAVGKEQKGVSYDDALQQV